MNKIIIIGVLLLLVVTAWFGFKAKDTAKQIDARLNVASDAGVEAVDGGSAK